MLGVVTDPPRVFLLSPVVVIDTGRSSLIVQTEVGVEFRSPRDSPKPRVRAGSGLIQLRLFIYLFIWIALRFWLRMSLGSLETEDKSDFPCIPRAA